jgi:excisionase family DNA binding protein
MMDNNMANGNLPGNMLTVSEVSRILHVHPNTLRRWADKGIIKSYSITSRGDRRFMPQDIERFLAETKAQNQY